jgi:hypothetical protein
VASRREVLKGAAAAPLAAGALGWSPASAAPPRALDLAIYDARFPVAQGLAAALGRARVAAHAISGDVTEVWYRRLDRRWRERPMRIGGLTDAAALFVLERLAWDQGLRVAWSITVPEAAALTPSAASALVRAFAAESGAGDPSPPPQPAVGLGPPGELVAWVIAPPAGRA